MPGYGVFLPRNLDDATITKMAEDFAAVGATNLTDMLGVVMNIDLESEERANELRAKGYTLMSGRLRALAM